MTNKIITKCDFCKHWSGSVCTVTPNSAYCKDAINEYYQRLRADKGCPKTVKSLHPWG